MIADSAGATLISATLTHNKVMLHSSILKAPQPRADNLTAVILHGAGVSNSERHEELASAFAEHDLEIIGGVSHQLAAWLAGHKTFSKQIVQYLAQD